MLVGHFQPSARFEGSTLADCVSCQTNRCARVVVGPPADVSWAVTELAEGGPKGVMFEAGGSVDIANDFPAEGNK